MTLGRAWLHDWIYYLAAVFMFAAVALRTILVYQNSPLLIELSALLAIWLVAFALNILLAGRLRWLSTLLVGF